MKVRGLTWFLLLICLIGLFGSACADVIVSDMAGNEIELSAPAERIVVLSASDCEILYAIGAGDKVVARGAYCNYPEEVLALPDVESGSETNIEQILALNPDLVIMSVMAQKIEHAEALRNAGVAVAVTNAQDVAGVYTAIEMLGALTGKEQEAGALVSDMASAFDEIKAKAGEGDGKTVYFEASPLEWGLWTAGSDTFMHEICEIVGLENAFSDVSGWAQISEEQVLKRDPDYIVTIAMYYGEGPKPDEEILARENWQLLKAVKNAAVFNMDSDQISRPGPRLIDAAAELYDYISAE